ncbi:MAG: hypothetical protein JSR99_03355 [Proteobacteria bacterium]|nr:hypothetical protein [Pseudomonadota bacterium]
MQPLWIVDPRAAYRGRMDKIFDQMPLALEILGLTAFWMLKATWLVTGIAVIVMWNLFRIALTALCFGRLPRSYIRAFD